MSARPATPAAARIVTIPIDDAARDGRFQIVFVNGRFALVRWVGAQWRFSSGAALPVLPTHYQPRKV